jgi:hypothetical protein
VTAGCGAVNRNLPPGHNALATLPMRTVYTSAGGRQSKPRRLSRNAAIYREEASMFQTSKPSASRDCEIGMPRPLPWSRMAAPPGSDLRPVPDGGAADAWIARAHKGLGMLLVAVGVVPRNVGRHGRMVPNCKPIRRL